MNQVNKIFEIHITGDESVIENAKKLDMSHISIDLLKPDKSVLRREHMTSHVRSFKDYEDCKAYVDEKVEAFKTLGTEIYRVKIETLYYEEFVDRSCYIESHFIDVDKGNYPISRNARKTEILGTDREYDKAKYEEFRLKHKGREVELCVYDTFVDEDKDWFLLFE
jgi:hypothetical protein